MFEAEIKRGIALLDEHEPDWRARLNATRLDMAVPSFEPGSAGQCGCVLAQLDRPSQGHYAGWYEVEAQRLMDAAGDGFADNEFANLHAWAVAHGFTIQITDSLRKFRQDFVDLTDAWRRALTEGAGP